MKACKLMSSVAVAATSADQSRAYRARFTFSTCRHQDFSAEKSFARFPCSAYTCFPLELCHAGHSRSELEPDN